MDKKLCDGCGKEITERSFSFQKNTFFLIWFNFKHKDFCSKECFLKYVDKNVR